MVGNVPDSNQIRLRAALDRWHNAHAGSGNSRTDSIALDEQIKAHPNIQKFLNNLEKGSLINPAVADALIAKWKDDPNFLNNLERNLADPAVANQLREGLRDPKNTPTLIAAIKAVGQEAAPAPAPAPVVAAAAPADSSPPPSPTATQPPAGQQPGTATTLAAPAPPAAAPAPQAPRGHGAGGRSGGGPPSRTEQGRPTNLVVDYAEQLAEKAKRDFGIDAATADGFVSRIKGDKDLQKAIYAQMQKHKDLKNSLNDFLLVDVNALGGHQPKAKAALTELLQHPEKLKDDGYVTELESNVAIMPKKVGSGTTFGRVSGQTRDASGAPTGGAGGNSAFSASGFMGGLQEMFGKLKDFFSSPSFMNAISQIWEQIKQLFSSFTASTGFAMGNNGNEMSQSLAGATGNGAGYHARTRRVDPDTGVVADGPRVDGLGPQHRRLPGGAVPSGTNGPGGHAVV